MKDPTPEPLPRAQIPFALRGKTIDAAVIGLTVGVVAASGTAGWLILATVSH